MDSKTRLRIVVGYAAVAAAWILLSDRVMYGLWPELASLYYAGLVKGLAFVGVTALILYYLLRRIRRTEASRYRTIFENHHAVMLLVDPANGDIVDANPSAAAFYGWPRERLRTMRMDDIDQLSAAERNAKIAEVDESGRQIQFQHRLASGEVHDVEVFSGTAMARGKSLLASIVYDVTERNRAWTQLRRQKNLYSAISEINQSIVRLPDNEEIFLQVCRTAVERVGFLFAWVGEVDAATATVRPVARYGDDKGYVDEARVSSDSTQSSGRGPSGTVIREGRHFIANDFMANEATRPWHEAAGRVGVRASGAFPIRCAGRVVAVLNIYSGVAGFFDDETTSLLSEMALDVSFALDNAERARREAATTAALTNAEERWRFALEGAGHGVWEWNVQTSRVLYSTQWKSQLGFADDEIGDMLDEWQKRVHPDDLPLALREIQRHLDGETPYYISEHRIRCKDGDYKWMLDRGKVMSRDDGSKPLLMLGTLTDITGQKLSSERLREADRRFQSLLGSVDMIAIMLDRDGRLTYCNNYFLGLTGWKREEILNRNWFDLFIPPEQHAVRNLLKDRVANADDAWHFHNEILTRSGERRLVRWNNTVLRSARGEMIGTASLGEDVTEQRRAEELLRNSENLYRQLFESNPHPMWVYDTDTLAFLAVNDTAVTHYGYSRDAFLAMTIRDIRPAEDVPQLKAKIASLNPQTSASGVWRHCKKNGEVILVDITSHGLHFEGRKARLVLAHDVTEATRTRLALAEEEEKFRALAETPLVGTYILDDGRITYANPRAADIFGYARGEMLGHSVLDIIVPEDQERVIEDIRRLAAGEASELRNEFIGTRKDGHPVSIGAGGVATTLGGRRVIVGMAQDITDKRRAEETIRHYITRLEHAVLGTVDAVSQMVELRDPYTAGHERRVGELSAAIAAEMGLDDNMQRGLRIAGAVHDIGKIGIPAEILSKPSRISPTEFELVKSHAQQGYEVLKGIDFPWPVAEVARQHHERLDGSGYPRGLKGDDILLEARIMAVSDVVESMASHRPYRPGRGIQEALDEIERGAGKIYDANVVAACLRLFRERKYELPQ